eukprot:TRINITY_DN6632_c0_g1_i1.p1 TRINITY_DN6632_c0_g1~~TRINITY_DN6632_c0_g1_i1.p1  ORF type:complete len:324 (-),score=107.27 TRINITY_DN6632_c0_g1_i1:212-1048(-)
MLSGLPPSSFDIACNLELSLPSIVATDNCPDCVVDLNMVESNRSGTCDNEFIVERKWTATDCGGNVALFHQVINVVDTEAPVMIGLYGHVVVSVGNIPTVTEVGATDNCQEVTPVFHERTLDGSCLDSYVILRTWSVHDLCGNSKTHEQSVHVMDNEAPKFSLPGDVTVDCENIPNDDDITATDNSGRPIHLQMDEETLYGTCSFNYELIRTFKAEDVCGNTLVSKRTITVVDQEAPVWVHVPDPYLHAENLPPHFIWRQRIIAKIFWCHYRMKNPLF